MSDQDVVVIGGSSGIGLEITRCLTESNQRVTVVSRSTPAVNQFKTASHLPLDISRDRIDPDSLPERIQGLVYCPGSIRLRPFQLQNDIHLGDSGIRGTLQPLPYSCSTTQPPVLPARSSRWMVAWALYGHSSNAHPVVSDGYRMFRS